MALFSFKARFTDPILAGLKRQTIRSPRKNLGSHGKVAGPISLVTGSRFKPRPLGRSVCTGLSGVTLNLAISRVILCPFVDGREGPVFYALTEGCELDAFAVSDGFRDWADLCAFWAETHPGLTLFSGICTCWGDLTK